MSKTMPHNTLNNHQNLDANFWNERWKNQETGWDIGYPSPAITRFFKNVDDKNTRILIPGCGNAYEAEFLLNQGFKNITILDIAPKAVERLQDKFKNNSEIKIVCEDFFKHYGEYDFMIEQTFFCAISPALRADYAKKASELLAENGQIVGLLFNKEFSNQEPPFGGTKEDYISTFKIDFEIIYMQDCKDSIPERQGNELFFQLKKIQSLKKIKV